MTFGYGHELPMIIDFYESNIPLFSDFIFTHEKLMCFFLNFFLLITYRVGIRPLNEFLFIFKTNTYKGEKSGSNTKTHY